MKKLAYMKTSLLLLLICFLMVFNCFDPSNGSLKGEWKWINNSNDKYLSVNVFHQGMVVYEDSLLLVGDYMFNPFFNKKKYSAINDSVFIWYDDGRKSFKYSIQNDSLTLINDKLIYIYKRINQPSNNHIDSLSFSSENPGRSSEENYFFELDINKEGKFVYRSKYQERKIEGRLHEKYRKFIFDKINKLETPVSYNKEEEIPQGDHVFILELFAKGVRVDSVIYSREIEGTYAKWVASILQSTPLWVDAAIAEK